MCECVLSCFSHVQLFVTPRTVAYQASLSMEFSRQEYWSELPCPPPGESSWTRDWNCVSWGSCTAGGFSTAEPLGKPLKPLSVQFGSVQLLSRVRLFVTPWIAARRPPCPSPTPRVYPNPHPSSRWCHPAISSSVVPFSCPQSLPASGSFSEV